MFGQEACSSDVKIMYTASYKVRLSYPKTFLYFSPQQLTSMLTVFKKGNCHKALNYLPMWGPNCPWFEWNPSPFCWRGPNCSWFGQNPGLICWGVPNCPWFRWNPGPISWGGPNCSWYFDGIPIPFAGEVWTVLDSDWILVPFSGEIQIVLDLDGILVPFAGRSLLHNVASTVGGKRPDWVSQLSQAFLHCLWHCLGDGSSGSGAVLVHVDFLALFTEVVEFVGVGSRGNGVQTWQSISPESTTYWSVTSPICSIHWKAMSELVLPPEDLPQLK
jgi:hypothetical protein